MAYTIATIAGDGIGPELMQQAKKVLVAIEKQFQLTFRFIDVCGGGASLDKYGKAITSDNLARCQAADAILLANVGGKKWMNNSIEKRPERLMYHLRGDLGLKVNVRPIYVRPELEMLSSIKPALLKNGLDLVVVRDVVGGVIPSKKYTGIGKDGEEASDSEYYNERIVKDTLSWAVKIAEGRPQHEITSLDKANALASSKLWRQIFHSFLKAHPDIQIRDELIDNSAQRVIRHPDEYDVLVTTNMFGDIISDEIVGLAGAGGTLGAATLSNDGRGEYEPNQLHNTDASIVGKDMADPLGLIMSLAMMMRYSFNKPDAASLIEASVDRVLKQGYSTPDICFAGRQEVGTSKMGDLVVKEILR